MGCVKQSFQEYMEGTLIPGIRMMQCKGFAYLSFGLIGTSIELLGCFFDEFPLEDEDHSRPRFNTAIDKLFVDIRPAYKRSCPCKGRRHDDHCLYKGLRCGMAHIARPQGMIAFTTRREAFAEKNNHLGRNGKERLILVAEDLADDFVAAWDALKTKSTNGQTKKKVTDDFLEVDKEGN
jgi:hypothetical protein